MSYSGYDIEDAIVMNKARLDRGFRAVHRASKVRDAGQEVLQPHDGPDRRADASRSARPTGRHRLLDRDGIASVGDADKPRGRLREQAEPRRTRAIRCRTRTRCRTPSTARRRRAYKGPQGESCVVDKVMLTMTDEGAVQRQVPRATHAPPGGGRQVLVAARPEGRVRRPSSAARLPVLRARRDAGPHHEPARVPEPHDRGEDDRALGGQSRAGGRAVPRRHGVRGRHRRRTSPRRS